MSRIGYASSAASLPRVRVVLLVAPATATDERRHQFLKEKDIGDNKPKKKGREDIPVARKELKTRVETVYHDPTHEYGGHSAARYAQS